MEEDHGPFRTLQGKQENSTIYHTEDQFLFFRYKTTDSAMYYRCTKYKEACPVRAVYYRWTRECIFSGQHTHINEGELEYRTARNSLLNEAQRLDIAHVQEVYNDPRAGNLPDQLNYHRLQPSLTRARMRALPRCETLAQLLAALNDPNYSCITAVGDVQNTLYQGSNLVQDGSVVCLFMSKVCSECLRFLPTVFISFVSFAIAGQQYKLCAISGKWDKAVTTLAWCVMDSETYETLYAAFLLLKSSLGSWQFNHAICGSDLVSHAFHSVFGVPVYPSLYDYIKDVKSFLVKSFPIPFENMDPHFSNIVKLCCALPLLPKDRLQIGLNLVSAESLRHGHVIHNQLLQLFHFIQEHWINNQCRNFCCFGDPNRTDYGSVEKEVIFNERIASRTNENFYCLTKYMVSITEDSEKDIRFAIQGERRRGVSFCTPLSQDENLLVLYKQLVSPTFGLDYAVRNFLNAAGEKLSFVL